MKQLIKRLRRAWLAFKTPWHGGYAVIYDYKTDGNDGDESYYGYFSSREEALRMLDDCYPHESKAIHNAHLVILVEELRPHDH